MLNNCFNTGSRKQESICQSSGNVAEEPVQVQTQVTTPPHSASYLNRTTIPGGCNPSNGGYHVWTFGFVNSNLFNADDNLVTSISFPHMPFREIREDFGAERNCLWDAVSEGDRELSRRCLNILMKELESYEHIQVGRYI